MYAKMISTASKNEDETIPTVVKDFHFRQHFNKVGFIKSCDTHLKEDDAFEIVHINDFASEHVKAEFNAFQTDHTLPSVNVCPSYHGGPLDYPKSSLASVAAVAEKWDLCYGRLEIIIQARIKKKKALSRSYSDEEVYEQLTGDSIKRPEPFDFSNIEASANAIDETKVNEEEFHSAICESASKLTIHCTDLWKALVSTNKMKPIFSVLGGIALMRNKLWYYNENIQLEGKSKPFQDSYNELRSMMEAMSEQLLSYHSNLITTMILTDANSNDFKDSKPFYEDMAISHTVRMWWYSLQGLKADLWNSISPKSAIRIFTGVFSDSLAVITTRLTHVSPSLSRLNQYRADVSAVLIICIEVLIIMYGSLEELLNPNYSDPFIASVHNRCNHLLASLALVGSPLETISSVLPDMAKPIAKLRKKNSKKTNENQFNINSEWMKLIRPDLFKERSPEVDAILLVKLMVSQPEPNWPLLVQSLLSCKQAVIKSIIIHFGGFMVGNRGGDNVTQLMTDGCQGFECNRNCIAIPDPTWPHYVGASAMIVAMNGLRSHTILVNLFEPLLEKMSRESWESLDRTNLWNPRKPVCMEAICQIIQPHLYPVVLELFDLIEAGKAWTMGHVDGAMKEILDSVHDILPLIPIQILNLTTFIQKKLPSGIKPLCNHVLTHLIISSLYSIISRLEPLLKSQKISREKLDFIIAFGEALCNLDKNVQLLQIQNITDQIAQEESEINFPERIIDTQDNEMSSALSEVVADDLLADELGSFSLKTLYRFLSYNVDWIIASLSKESGVMNEFVVTGKMNPLIKPWGSTVYPFQSPYAMLNQIDAFGSLDNVQAPDNNDVGVKFCVSNGNGVNSVVDSKGANDNKIRFDDLLTKQHPWEEYLRHVLLNSNPMANSEILRMRTELHSDEVSSSERDKANDLCETWDKIRLLN